MLRSHACTERQSNVYVFYYYIYTHKRGHSRVIHFMFHITTRKWRMRACKTERDETIDKYKSEKNNNKNQGAHTTKLDKILVLATFLFEKFYPNGFTFSDWITIYKCSVFLLIFDSTLTSSLTHTHTRTSNQSNESFLYSNVFLFFSY